MDDTSFNKSELNNKDEKPRLWGSKSKRQPGLRVQYSFLPLAVLLVIVLTVFTVWGIRTAVYSDRLSDFEVTATKAAATMEFSVLQNKYAVVPETLGIANSNLRQTILGKRPPDNPDLVKLLSDIKAVNRASLAYVMNAKGIVVGGTPYDGGKSLVGNSYAFRPYFKEAIKGKNYLYAALGITTKKRGLYYSSPVYSSFNESKQADGIIGVIVLKLGLSEVDAWLNSIKGPVALVTSRGIIFACNRKEWMFHTTEVSTTVDSMQYSDKERADLKYLKVNFNEQWVDLDNGTYAVARNTLNLKDEFGNWKLVWLQDISTWFPLWKMVVSSALVALFYFLLVLLFLHQAIRKRAEAALQESEARFSGFARASGYGFAMAELTGQLVFGNSEILRIVEEEREADFVSKTFYQYYTKKDIKRLEIEILPIVMEKGHWTGEFPLLTAKGNLTPTEQNFFLISDVHETLQVVGNIITDITERKLAEEALRTSEEKLARSKKMESLGLLAGGVAHDLNNVLSGIVGYPELLLLDIPKDSELRKPIEQIQDTGHRATAIVQDLITVARGVAIAKEPLDLNAIVEAYLRSPEFEKLEQFHSTVTVKTNLDTDLFNIIGSEAHLRKVVMNLVSNASEAIADSGDVIISTINRYVDRPIRGYDDVSVGEYAVLSVSDEGSGISPDDLERIFEPFYTKKIMGRSGTGLGLAVVWNVVQDLKGYLDVTTDENGTTFELYFPTTRDAVMDKELSIPIEEFKGDDETVLIIDDVESQREIACKMLNILGYKAIAVSSGEEAVEYLKEHTVDLLLLDMIMDPGINGRETYEQIIKIHPDQKAVIASGFADTDDVKETQKLGAGQYIKKPLTLEKLGIAIRDELQK